MIRIIVFICCLFFSFSAQSRSMNEVLVSVDFEAEDSVKARDLAMMDAQRKAFIGVAGMFTSTENVEKLSQLSDEEILYFVQSVGVVNERSGGTKYKADLTVKINDKLLKDYLAENEMIVVEVSELMVIPVYKMQNNTLPLLWESENHWMNIWKEKGVIKFGSMQIKTISDKFRNIADLTAENSLYMSDTLFNQIKELNDSDKIYVLFAERNENGDLNVTVKNERNKVEDSFAVHNDGESDVFDLAVEKTVMFVSNMERETEKSSVNGDEGFVNIVYVYQNMKDWLQKSNAMSKLPQIEALDTRSFGGGKVNFVIKYRGNIDDLWTALLDMGISHEQEGSYFVIR